MSESMNPRALGFSFTCKGEQCRHSCCGPFSGISRKISSVDGRPFDEIVLTEEDCRLLTESGHAALIEEGYAASVDRAYRKLALEADGRCRAWVDGRCSIYEARPTLCRAFPFYFDLFSGLCVIRCEGCSRGHADQVGELADGTPTLKAYRPYMEHAKKMYEYWLNFYTNSDGEPS